MPFLPSHTVARWGNTGKDGMESFDAMGWEFNGHADCVDEPAQDKFSCCPGAIAMTELLDGGRFLAVGTVGQVQTTEDLVKAVEQSALGVSSSTSIALYHVDIVVHVHIGVS